MLVMDSGLGGISVVRALRKAAPEAPLLYLADTAGFPYGGHSADTLIQRAQEAILRAAERSDFSTVVLACNTLSTLALAELRRLLPYRFVGTVPAIKVAAGRSQTRRFTLLATPNTAHSEYSRALIAEFAAGCVVDCYGAPKLAAMVERSLLGEQIDTAALRAEMAPAFHDDAQGKTDAMVLGCTHYPLILPQLQQVAPWQVAWIDSAQAIARQALLTAAASPAKSGAESIAYVTAPQHVAAYARVFAAEGFTQTQALHLLQAPTVVAR